jgi:thiol-activated cytolysin
MPSLNRYALMLASASCVVTAAHAQRADLDQYVRSLTYDPRLLLAVKEDGSQQTLPAYEQKDNAVVICTNQKKGADKSVSEVTVLAPTAGVIYPGALVRVNQALAAGKPEPITVSRAPLVFSLDLPGLGAQASRRIEQASHSKVQAAMDDVIGQWFAGAAAKGYRTRGKASLKIEKAETKEQVAIKLGLNAKWMDNEITSNVDTHIRSGKTTHFALYRQVFYSAIADAPSQPSAVFAAHAPLDEIRQQTDAKSPPGFVRSVDYGRLVLVRIDTDFAVATADVEGMMKYVSESGSEFKADTDNKFERIARNSRFTAVVLGGSAADAARIFRPNGLKELYTLIERGAEFSKANPAVPIAYTVAFLKNQELATMAFSTEYIDTACKEFPAAYVRLRHDGAYVGKFQVTWKEHDSRGALISRSWESGEKTAGWTQSLRFNGDASQIQIRAWAATGLLWDPWGEAMNVTLASPANQCFRVTGTTLNRGHERYYDGGDCRQQ